MQLANIYVGVLILDLERIDIILYTVIYKME